MDKGYLDMLFSRKERALNYHIRWGNFIHMCRAESCYSTQFILSVKLEQRTVTSLLEDKGTI